MKAYIKLIIPISIFVFIYNYHVSASTINEKNINSTGIILSEEDHRWIDSVLSSMSLYEKCAQLIMPYATSFDTSSNSEEYQRIEWLVKDLKVGGIIFFQGDISGQVALTNKLQSLAQIPLLIASDYERGVGMRLQDAVEYPYNMAFGAANDPHLTYLMGKYTALEGRALGVHHNFAPLLDVNHDYRNPIINIRAYSEDPNIIAWHAKEFLKGMHEGNMLTTAKHFPGHGATSMDSHNELPVINLTSEDLINFDLIPFIESFNAEVKSVMIGHLEVPAIEGKRNIPATFSYEITTNFLQNKLGFDGLVVTDAMNMYSITTNYTHEEAAKLAIQAGNDIILFPEDEEASVLGIYAAVLSGELTEERIDISVRKILSAKKWLKLNESKPVDINSVSKILNNRTHWRLAEEVAERSITLVKDNKNILPINPDDYYSTACITLSNTIRRSSLKEPLLFEELVNENFNYVKNYRLNLSSKKRNYRQALKIAKKSNLILLATYISVRAFQDSLELEKEQLNFIKELITLNKPLVIMSFGNPYILSEFPEADTYLCSYGQVLTSQTAMLNSIIGRNKIGGKLPITIPNTDFSIGYGIDKDRNGLYFQSLDVDSNYNFIKVDSLMNFALEDSVFPGAVLLVGHRGKVIYHKPFGKFSYDEDANDMTPEAMFDIASLTKVFGTTSAAMILFDQGKLDLDEKVVSYIPEFGNNLKDKITIRNLLLHNSGLPAFKPYYKLNYDSSQVIKDIMNTELKFEPGTKYLYSDLGIITLQKVIEKISGETLDKFLTENVFAPLGMNNTMFNPPHKVWYYCVPTEKDEYWRMITVKGKVHDETASILGGTAGHAGLFSTAEDLAKLTYIILNHGKNGDSILFRENTVTDWTSKQTNQSTRGLGWDTKSEKNSSAGNKFSLNSFGHTGFTGTSVWVDNDRELFVILLSNRVHPTRQNRNIYKFRPLIHDAVIDAVTYD